jgi:hypothetical protein
VTGLVWVQTGNIGRLVISANDTVTKPVNQRALYRMGADS